MVGLPAAVAGSTKSGPTNRDEDQSTICCTEEELGRCIDDSWVGDRRGRILHDDDRAAVSEQWSPERVL
jgi:hypothetical protein